MEQPLPEPTDERPDPGEDRLVLARRIEQTTSLARQLRARLKGGPWRRARRRARRQLDKLATALEATQRSALSEGAGEVDVAGTLDALDTLLQHALYAAPSREGLKELRRVVKAARRVLQQRG